MELFLDTAEVKEIREAHSWGVLDGVTTNPTLIAKSGRNFHEVVKEICDIVKGPVSAETVSPNAEGMISEAKELSAIDKHVVVKIVMTSEGMKAVKWCAQNGVKTNVTVTFSANQALLAAKAGANYVSPFVGRLDDVGQDGMQVVRDILCVYNNYGFKTKVLAASIRHPIHVFEAAKAGAHVATLPFKVLEQMFKHPLTDIGIEKFLADWEKAKK